MTENGFQTLLEIRRLESLSLSSVSIEKQDLSDDHLKRMQSLDSLRSLELRCSKQVTDQGIATVVKLPRLELLSLADISLNGEGFAPLTRLKNIAIQWCSSHTDHLLKCLSELP